MNILVDCDDVLLDWIGGFWDFCEEEVQRSLDRRGPMGWCMSSWIGVEPETSMEMIREFNGSHRFGNLRPTVGAVETFRELSKTNEIHVITSCSTAPETVAMRERNLEDVFGNIFSSITCLDLGTPKTAALQKHSSSIWVEDNVRNALIGADLGHTTFVRRVTHNRHQEVRKECLGKLQWFSEWAEFHENISS